MGSPAPIGASRSRECFLHGKGGQKTRDLANPVITGFGFHDTREYREFRHFVAMLCNLSQSR
jgi:hypothetical protein